MVSVLLQSKSFHTSKMKFESQIESVNHDLFETKRMDLLDQYLDAWTKNPKRLGKIRTLEQFIMLLGHWAEKIIQLKNSNQQDIFFKKLKELFRFIEEQCLLLQSRCGKYTLEGLLFNLPSTVNSAFNTNRLSNFLRTSIRSLSNLFQAEEISTLFLIACPKAAATLSPNRLCIMVEGDLKAAKQIFTDKTLLKKVGNGLPQFWIAKFPERLYALVSSLNVKEMQTFLIDQRDGITCENLFSILPLLYKKMSREQVNNYLKSKADSQGKRPIDKILKLAKQIMTERKHPLLKQLLPMMQQTDLYKQMKFSPDELLNWVGSTNQDVEISNFICQGPDFYLAMKKMMKDLWSYKKVHLGKKNIPEFDFMSEVGSWYKNINPYINRYFYLCEQIDQSKKWYQTRSSAQKKYLKEICRNGVMYQKNLAYVIAANDSFWKDVKSITFYSNSYPKIRKQYELYPDWGFERAREYVVKNASLNELLDFKRWDYPFHIFSQVVKKELIMRIQSDTLSAETLLTIKGCFLNDEDVVSEIERALISYIKRKKSISIEIFSRILKNFSKHNKVSKIVRATIVSSIKDSQDIATILAIKRYFSDSDEVSNRIKEFICNLFQNENREEIFQKFIKLCPRGPWFDAITKEYKHVINFARNRAALIDGLHPVYGRLSPLQVLTKGPLASRNPLQIIFEQVGIDAKYVFQENYKKIAMIFDECCNLLQLEGDFDTNVNCLKERFREFHFQWISKLDFLEKIEGVNIDLSDNLLLLNKFFKDVVKVVERIVNENWSVKEKNRIKDAYYTFLVSPNKKISFANQRSKKMTEMLQSFAAWDLRLDVTDKQYVTTKFQPDNIVIKPADSYT